MKAVKREKATTTKGHYVTNATLLPEVIKAKALGRITPELARMLMMIAERYSRKSWFSGYSYREDMVSAALVNLCSNNTGIPNALKFNPEKSNNPFSYYTTAVHNSFQQFKGVEKNHRNTRDKLLIDAGSNPSYNFMLNEDDVPTEIIDSDEVEFTIEKDITELSEDELQKLEEAIHSEAEVARPHHRANKEGSKVTVYKAKDIIQNIDGTFEIKPKPEKKPRKHVATKKVATKKVAAAAVKKEPTTKKAAIKKTPAKKAATKKVK